MRLASASINTGIYSRTLAASATCDTMSEGRERCRLLRGTWCFAGGITVLSLVPSLGLFVPAWRRLEPWSTHAAMWLPLGQLVGMAGLLLVLRSPRTRRDGARALRARLHLAAGAAAPVAADGL